MIIDLFRIDDRVAIITGSGRGIGAASALALAQCGAHVVHRLTHRLGPRRGRRASRGARSPGRQRAL